MTIMAVMVTSNHVHRQPGHMGKDNDTHNDLINQEAQHGQKGSKRMKPHTLLNRTTPNLHQDVH